MPVLSDKGLALLGSASVDMKVVGAKTIFTTPIGKSTRLLKVVVRGASASLAGGTNYSITSFRSAFSLASLTAPGTGFVVVQASDLAQYSDMAGGVNVQLTVTTGSTASATATIDVFGYTN